MIKKYIYVIFDIVSDLKSGNFHGSVTRIVHRTIFGINQFVFVEILEMPHVLRKYNLIESVKLAHNENIS